MKEENTWIVATATDTDADGNVEVTIGTVGTNETWWIERVVVETDSGDPSAFSVYLGSVQRQNRVEYTPNGNQDVADEAQPILCPSGLDVIGRWEGVAPAAGAPPVSCSVRLQVRKAIGGRS